MPAARDHHRTRDEQQLRETEECFADGRQALEELRAKEAVQQQVRPSDTSRARALHRLAAERAGLATIIPAAARKPPPNSVPVVPATRPGRRFCSASQPVEPDWPRSLPRLRRGRWGARHE